eukprot:TRINITY_DN3326_c0_g1_i2.p3 TRINITY_DN3326_c0_g1~~TRINITY_DN3326_c0_g1_i2.p3  ORF type:complete len:166 (-),score=29.82 TRINITY_DN3326_c0_g1_i2:507-1004(-)
MLCQNFGFVNNMILNQLNICRCRNLVWITPTRRAVRKERSQQSVRAIFKFGKFGDNAKSAGMYGSQSREDYGYDDVEQYFNYMGMLATEGSYDTVTEMMQSGLEAVDILLLWACQENDVPKVEELLAAGAHVDCKNNKEKTPMEITTKEEIKELLQKYSTQTAST